MANGQDQNLAAVISVLGDVTTAAKFDRPFAKLRRHVSGWPSHLRMGREQANALAYRFDSSSRGVWIFLLQKSVESGKVAKCRLRPD